MSEGNICRNIPKKPRQFVTVSSILLPDQMHFFNDPTFIFHMIFFPTVGADPLSDGIKAAATIRAEDRCDGESRFFLSGNIFHKDCVDAVSAFLNLSIIFIIIDPPGSDGHVHPVSFQPEFVQAEAIGIGHLQNICELCIPRSSRIAGQILRFFRQDRHTNQRHQLSLKFIKGKFLIVFQHRIGDLSLGTGPFEQRNMFHAIPVKNCSQKSYISHQITDHTTSQQCHHKAVEQHGRQRPEIGKYIVK